MKSETFSECRAEYERRGGRERGDRIVRCGKALGHRGDHEEADGGATWPRAAACTCPGPIDISSFLEQGNGDHRFAPGLRDPDCSVHRG